MEVKKEITKPTSGGIQIAVSTPDTGKIILGLRFWGRLEWSQINGNEHVFN
jgi:hypothetical protein